MATTLQLVLQSDVDNVGKSGELVKVRPGFARNYLVPRGLAVPATEGAVKRIAHEKAVALAKADKSKKEAQEVAIAGIPMRRAGYPPDVASAAAWLCSEGAGWITGEIININGGQYFA